MHELALCDNIRHVIELATNNQDVQHVRKVRLEIGRFASVEKSALEFAFDVAMRGSIADGAKLDMVDAKGTALCQSCKTEVELKERFDPCPLCGGTGLTINGGTQLRVLDLEVQ